MKTININNLRDYIQTIKEPEFETIGKGNKFYADVSKTGFKYMLEYNFDIYSIWHKEKVIKNILDRFNTIHSFRPVEYRDISKDATYLLGVIRAYLGESWRDKGSEKREISSFYIGNFKAISDLQKVPIKPLTLIYGANSSGKSSIIHSLLALNHILTTGEYDVHQPRLGDGSVDLGGLDTYLHRENDFVLSYPDRRRKFPLDSSDFSFSIGSPNYFRAPFEWGVKIKTKYLTGDMRKLLKPAEQILIKATEDTYEIEINSQILLYMKRPSVKPAFGKRFYTEKNYNIEKINLNSSFISRVLSSTINKGSAEQIKNSLIKKIVADKLIHKGRARSGPIIPQGIYLTQAKEAIRGVINNNPNTNISKNVAKVVNEVSINIIQQLNNLQHEISVIVQNMIESLEYLGPVRSLSDEKDKFQQFYIIPYNVSGSLDVNEILLNNQGVMDSVNKWLISEDKLRTSYMFVVREYIPCDDDVLGEITHINWEELTIGLAKHFRNKLEEGELESVIVELNDAIRNSNVPGFFRNLGLDTAEHFHEALGEAINEEMIRKDLILIDRRTEIPVSSKNIGMGINQILPILISSFGLNNRVIMIEQPELHLHPALQAEVADVFIESALGTRQNTFLLESHSEHLLLRIMRRMRETFEGKLPDGIPPVTPDDIAVLFVEPDGAHSIVREMPLNERGELLKAWPGGFFEEGLREVFPEDAS